MTSRGGAAATAAAPRRETGSMHMYAVDVAHPERIQRFLEMGGHVNDVPLFATPQEEVCFAVCCPLRYKFGDVGQREGPLDPVDFDEKWCGADEIGTAGYAGGNRTLLHWAAYFKNPESVKLLIKSGADTLALSVKGKTPLDIAMYVGAPVEVLAMLRYDHGAFGTASAAANAPRTTAFSSKAAASASLAVAVTVAPPPAPSSAAGMER